MAMILPAAGCHAAAPGNRGRLELQLLADLSKSLAYRDITPTHQNLPGRRQFRPPQPSTTVQTMSELRTKHRSSILIFTAGHSRLGKGSNPSWFTSSHETRRLKRWRRMTTTRTTVTKLPYRRLPRFPGRTAGHPSKILPADMQGVGFTTYASTSENFLAA